MANLFISRGLGREVVIILKKNIGCFALLLSYILSVINVGFDLTHRHVGSMFWLFGYYLHCNPHKLINQLGSNSVFFARFQHIINSSHSKWIDVRGYCYSAEIKIKLKHCFTFCLLELARRGFVSVYRKKAGKKLKSLFMPLHLRCLYIIII